VTTVRPALDAALRHTIALRTEAIFRSTGAYRESHVALADGRHGGARLETFRLLEDPVATGELCGFLAEHGRGRDREPLVGSVAGTALAGAILAFETARQLGVRSLVTDALRVEPGEHLLVVDDVVATGGSHAAVLSAIEAMGGEIVEWVVLVDLTGESRATITSRTSGRVYPLRSLWQLEIPTFEPGPATCPRCADGTPLATSDRAFPVA
jgi:orotate phosphoribosyltransferase